MSEIKGIVANTIAITFASLLFLFAFTWIIFDFNGSSTSLKDTLGIVGSVFGGISTLAAAYIGSKLFNNWRDQENFNRAKDIHDEAVIVIIESAKLLSSLRTELTIIETTYKNKLITAQEDQKLGSQLSSRTKDVVIGLQSITHDISVKILMDYSESINSDDSKLKFVFNVVLDLNDFAKKLAHDRGVNENNINYVVSFIDNINIKLDSYMKETVTNFKRGSIKEP